MPGDLDSRPRSKCPICRRGKRRDRPSAPRRDVHRAIGRDGNTVWVTFCGQTLNDAPRRQIDDGQRVSEILGDVERPSIPGDGDASRIMRSIFARLSGSQHDRVGESRASIAPIEPVYQIFVTARDVQRVSIGAERESQENSRQGNLLEDATGGSLDDLYALLPPAVEQNYQ